VKILVTGGGGFAGRYLLRELLADGGREVAATTLGGPPHIPDGDPLSRVTWFGMDTSSMDAVRTVLSQVEPDLVFHLAGQASVGQSFDAPVETWAVNASGTVRLMAALGEQVVRPRRFLLVSSAEVYGEVDAVIQPVREETPYRPVSPYGASKAAAETAALQMGRMYGIEIVVARSFNHIGPGQDERFVLPSMARQLAEIRAGRHEPLLRVGNLKIDRDFLDVRDVVRAYMTIMFAGEAGRTYNVCSGRTRSLEAVITRLVSLSGTDARIEVDPDRVRPVDIPVMVGDPGRLRALGWNPRFDLDETLRDVLEEVRSLA